MRGVFASQNLSNLEGVVMELSEETICKELLLDLVCYEIRSKHLSPEMEYLFEKHLEECPSCRHRILGFRRILDEAEVVRNYG